MTHDLGEAVFRLSDLWWKFWIDRRWPKGFGSSLSRWDKFLRRIAIRGSLLLLNSNAISEACFVLDFPLSCNNLFPYLERYLVRGDKDVYI